MDATVKGIPDMATPDIDRLDDVIAHTEMETNRINLLVLCFESER